MTKVWMNPNLLQYQWEMKEALRQVIRENYVGGTRQAERVEVPQAVSLWDENLLPPPCITLLSLDAYEGQGDDYIGIIACHDFGIASMRVTILDERRGLIESGEAFPFPNDPELWDYLPTVRVPSGTTVRVYVTATDCMNGIGRLWQRKKLGEA